MTSFLKWQIGLRIKGIIFRVPLENQYHENNIFLHFFVYFDYPALPK